MTGNVFEEFQWRDMIYDATPGVQEALATEKVTVYIGFDPTADSLHVGHLLQVTALARIQQFGHTPIAIIGGATGLIGDPSGKSNERTLLSREQVEHNLQGIKAQLEPFLDFGPGSNAAAIVNNAEWFDGLSTLDFLRDVGKHFSVNQMLAKESVQKRLAGADGISYTEFSYSLLQSYDFVVLNQRYGCTLQMGGSDQWGNITAGIDLVRRMTGQRAYGIVFGLVTNSNGAKFGKTESGAVWLDPRRTSPFRFYQFWLNTDDRDAGAYLRYFTFLSQDEITGLCQEMDAAPEQRTAQRRLAREVTRMVHGDTALAKAEQATQVLFGSECAGLDASTAQEMFADVPSTAIAKGLLEGSGTGLPDVLVQCGLAASLGEGRRLIEAGGVYVNNRRVGDAAHRLTLADSIEGQVLVLRKGKKGYHLLRLNGS